jgi:hypothetical protein
MTDQFWGDIIDGAYAAHDKSVEDDKSEFYRFFCVICGEYRYGSSKASLDLGGWCCAHHHLGGNAMTRKITPHKGDSSGGRTVPRHTHVTKRINEMLRWLKAHHGNRS